MKKNKKKRQTKKKRNKMIPKKMHRFSQITGRTPAQNIRYTSENKFRGIRWPEFSYYIRFVRDQGACLKCGAIPKNDKDLHADHFMKICYKWQKQFFNPNKIQSLCKPCHLKMPKENARYKEWKKYCFLNGP